MKYFHIVRSEEKLRYLAEFVNARRKHSHSAVFLFSQRNTGKKLEGVKVLPQDAEKVASEILESDKVMVW